MAVTRSQSKSRERKTTSTRDDTNMILFKRKPFLVLYYAAEFLVRLALRYALLVATIIGGIALIYTNESEHIAVVKFNLYWLLLGIASSIGFGSGLHTFLIYLGPHIVHVTHYAQKCGLPNNVSFNLYNNIKMKCHPQHQTEFLDIFFAIFFNAFCWGIGTAVGELPPYFIAKTDHKAADELKEIHELLKKKTLTTVEWIKVNLYKLMKNYGFLGILLCASVFIINLDSQSFI